MVGGRSWTRGATYAETEDFGLRFSLSVLAFSCWKVVGAYIIPDKGDTLGRVSRSATVWLLVGAPYEVGSRVDLPEVAGFDTIRTD